jgi:hypothetical protein
MVRERRRKAVKTVKKIEVTRPVLPTRKKVAAYARVSMETDRMMHSISTQVSYYNELIQSNPEWEFRRCLRRQLHLRNSHRPQARIQNA